jgi:hypothetical protein
VRQFIAGMGYADLKHETLRLRVGFIKKGLVSSNQIVRLFAHRHFVTDLHSACPLFNCSKFNCISFTSLSVMMIYYNVLSKILLML